MDLPWGVKAQPDHIAAGCNVLLHAMLGKAGVVAGT